MNFNKIAIILHLEPEQLAECMFSEMQKNKVEYKTESNERNAYSTILKFFLELKSINNAIKIDDSKLPKIKYHEAISNLKLGKKLRRASWKKEIFIYQIVDTIHPVSNVGHIHNFETTTKSSLIRSNQFSVPYESKVLITPLQNEYNWSFSMEDITADDWVVVR